MILSFISGPPGVFEIVVVLFLIMLLFGAKRLPELARSLGRSLSEFKRGKDEGSRELPSADEQKNDDEKASSDT